MLYTPLSNPVLPVPVDCQSCPVPDLTLELDSHSCPFPCQPAMQRACTLAQKKSHNNIDLLNINHVDLIPLQSQFNSLTGFLRSKTALAHSACCSACRIHVWIHVAFPVPDKIKMELHIDLIRFLAAWGVCCVLFRKARITLSGES